MPQFSPASAPTASATPLPVRRKDATPTDLARPDEAKASKSSFPLPTLRLEIRDLNHAGAQTFLSSVIASTALQTAVQSVLRLLYKTPTTPTTTVPSTRSVTLILRSMPGVAFTTGNELDSDHKEIQYNGFGTCPSGLIEGIADWVRLNADLSPPHWKKEASGKWDAGYQHTGYFLQYLEDRFGEGTIRRANEKLRLRRYEEKPFWTELCGRPVDQLWGDYGEVVEKERKLAEEEECVIVDREEAQMPGKEVEGRSEASKSKPTATSSEGEYHPPAGVV